MNLIELKHFAKTINDDNSGICANDFKEDERTAKINPEFIISISEIRIFYMPFSREFVGKYVVVTMSNNDAYYLHEKSYIEFYTKLLNNQN